MNDSHIVRFITVEGVVQGVGFRPYVARHAAGHALRGWVRNTGGHVEILISGKPDAVCGFLLDIRRGPPQSDIKRFSVTDPFDPDGAYGCRSAFQGLSLLPALPVGNGFIILESTSSPSGLSMPPSDLCLCDRCLHEMGDAGNRRYRHPFISCTDCGPRYSILESYPFDRRTTSMIDFPMCPACEAEYHNPADRRYHAQTVSCHHCGPQLALHRGKGTYSGAVPAASDAIIAETIRLLRAGGIVALKGIGGYQLLCDPFSEDAVARLRVLKQRDAKPFAVMFPSVDSILGHCRISETERELLASPAHPIVLLEPLHDQGSAPLPAHPIVLLEPLHDQGSAPLPASPDKPSGESGLNSLYNLPLKAFSPLVCSGSRHIGAFLPYTPLHHLILRETGPLVATSANLSGHPIVSDDTLMKNWLHAGLDGVLSNDRRIISPQDDSVAWVVNGHPQLLRRARGYAPLSLPVKLPVGSNAFPLPDSTVLALGGQQKAGWCLVKDDFAHLGEYLGDLSDEAAWLAWNHSIAHAMDLLGGNPDIIACDAHPRYRTWKLPLLADLPEGRIVPVQHHHAHIASVMAEHGLEGPVLGVSFDGTGYGSDGSVWGGEFLVCTGGEFMRAAALKPISMLGGDASAEEGWKSLLCHLHAAGLPLPVSGTMAERDSLAAAALANGVNVVTSSSMGRLFDAVSALLGYAQTSRYEGECAILLEVAAFRASQKKAAFHDGINSGFPSPAFGLGETKDGLPILDPAPLFSGLLEHLRAGMSPDLLAWAFHNAVACATMEMLEKLSPTYPAKDIVLSGGVFQNRLLLDLLLPMLAADGFRIHLHRQVPPNDGGLALGQAFVARRKG